MREGLKSFPTEVEKLRGYLRSIVIKLKDEYPNLRIIYLSDMLYAGHATTGFGEPYFYESAFAVRWLVEAQMKGDQDLNYDPAKGTVEAPLLLWGLYLWANGLNPRSDGLTWRSEDYWIDGMHPSESGADKVAHLLLTFLKTNDLANSWYLEPPFTTVPSKRYDEAIHLGNLELAEAYTSRGNAYFNLGQYEPAIQDFGQAIRLNPELANPYVKRALAYTHLGMEAEAQQDINRAVELGFDSALLEGIVEQAKQAR